MRCLTKTTTTRYLLATEKCFKVCKSLPHYSLHCSLNPPMQEEDAKMAHRCQSLYDIQNIWPCVSTVRGRSESTKIERLINKYFSFNIQILFNIDVVFTRDASGLVRRKISSKYSAASRCSYTERRGKQKSV